MQTTHLGDLTVSRIGIGTASMAAGFDGAGSDDTESIRTIHRALDLGATLIDAAEFYGPYVNEELVGKALVGHRDAAVVATKFGMISHVRGDTGLPDSSPANVRAAVEGSLRRLRTDRIDLCFQHRVDPQVPIEDTVGALAELVAEGKVLHIGLSEAGPETIRRAHAVHPLAAVESEYSVWTRDPEAAVLPVLRELGIGFVAYSPLGRGFLTGTLRSAADISATDWRAQIPRFQAENFDHNLRLADQVAAVASEAGTTPAQVALAWLLSRGPDVVPIPGTKRIARLEENLAAAAVALSEDQLAQLDALDPAVGEHHSLAQLEFLDG